MRVGIDLGTTYSVVAKYNANTSQAEVIRNNFNKELTPSVVCFLDNGTVLVGEEAKSMQRDGVGDIGAYFKTSIGITTPCVWSDGHGYTAEELSKILFKELVKNAEAQAGEKVDSAVITVPAYFNDIQRRSTKAAAEAAGIKVSRIMNEPTAAAIYYGYKHQDGKKILVFDLGGGTFDITIIQVKKGSIDVVATDGNRQLGGKDWDQVLLDHLCDQFYDIYGVNPAEDDVKRYELMTDCERYKKELSQRESVKAEVVYNGHKQTYIIRREEFEEMTSHLVNATDDVLNRILAKTGLTPADIDEVLLCGGSSRIPAVKKKLESRGFRNIPPHTDTDLAVAKGAAIVASIYSNDINRIRDVTISDVCSHSLGALSIHPTTEEYYNQIVIPCNTRVPASKTKPFRIEPGNMTDQIELYMLQGESTVPYDCTVIKHEIITGFENNGSGLNVNITYSYDDEGSVSVTAERNGKELTVIHESLPSDTSWLKNKPQERSGSKRVAKSIVICIDLSRSMWDHLEEVKTAIHNFVATFNGEFTKFALVGFGDKVKVISDLTGDEDDILEKVDQLRKVRCGRGTDANPFEQIIEQLSGEKGCLTALILTDGIWGKRDEAVLAAEECREKKIGVFAIGFGDADISFLRQIATIEQNAMYIKLNSLNTTINTIATAIIDNPTGLMEHFR